MSLKDIPQPYRPVIDHRRMLLGCIALAVSLAALVLTLLDKITPKFAIVFLAVASVCFAVSLLLPPKQN